MTSVSSPRSTSTDSSNSGFCAGSDQPGGARILATDTEALPVLAAPMNSSMRLPSSRGMSFPLRSLTIPLLGAAGSGALRLAVLLGRGRHEDRRALQAPERPSRVLRTRVVDAL